LPKLLETCKRYMQFEQETLEKVMRARASLHWRSKSKDGRALLLSASDGESLGRPLRVRAVAGLATCLGSSAQLGWLATHF
jgi:hypothetical protein